MPLVQRSREFLSLRVTRSRTLRSNFTWNAAGNGVFAICQWGTLIVIAKMGNPALVGQVIYGLALTAPLFVIAQMQLRPVQATDTDNRYALGQYVGLRVITTIAALALTTMIAAIVWARGSKTLALIILLWALSKVFDSGSDCLYGLFQQSERMDYVGVSFSLRGLLALASIALLFRASHSAPIALTGLVASWVAVFILFDIPVARTMVSHRTDPRSRSRATTESLRPILDRRPLIRLGLETTPLGIVAFLLTIQTQIPRYVVAGLLDTRKLGLFSAAAYLTFVGALLVNALGAPAIVHLAKYHIAQDRSAFRKLTTQLLFVAIALGIAGILVSVLFGRRILALLYTKEYSSMAGVLTILCGAGALSYVASFLGCAMTALRRYAIQLPINLCVVTVILLTCYWLTRDYGLLGTALGVLTGNLVQVLMCAAVVWRTLARYDKQAASECRRIGTAESVL